MEIDKAEKRKLTLDEEAAMLRVSNWLSEEEVEENLRKQLLALSVQQQAGDLFVLNTSADNSTIPYRLNISLQEIGFFRTPENPRNGQMWAAVDAKLTKTGDGVEPIHQRICYGSHKSQSLISWGEEI